jgi:hypothetical protein
VLFVTDEVGREQANGGWFTPPMVNIIPLVLAPLVPGADPDTARFLLILSYAAWGVGFFLFLMVAALLYTRLVHHPLPSAPDLRASRSRRCHFHSTCRRAAAVEAEVAAAPNSIAHLLGRGRLEGSGYGLFQGHGQPFGVSCLPAIRVRLGPGAYHRETAFDSCFVGRCQAVAGSHAGGFRRTHQACRFCCVAKPDKS